MHKLVLLPLALLCTLMVAQTQARSQEAPVVIDFFELEKHRVAGSSSFRSSDAPSGSAGTVFLEIVIDESGAVVAVKPGADNEPGEIRRWYKRAEALARQWRFRPFTRDGRAVQVTARGQMDVLPPVRWGRKRRFPDVPIEHYSVTLARGGCFGTCPVYTVTVHGDGRVRFEGSAYTAASGVHEATISPDRVERLIAMFRKADFWSLRRRYVSKIADAPGYRLTVQAGSRTWSVSDVVGREIGMPDVVRRLQDAVDEAAGTARWIEGEGGSGAKR